MSDRLCGCHVVTAASIITSLQDKTMKIFASRWSKSILELVMAWYVGFASFWLFSIIILILSFKYYRPVFVIPNFTALVLGCFMNLTGFGSMLGRILDSSKEYQTNDYEESILCYIMGLMLLAFFACLAFIIFIHRYHKFLRLRYGQQVPKVIYIIIRKMNNRIIYLSK
uniref:Uncharacterized protein n=1 Tax=Heterorhabditis bacteriophora TaxID=37862 RepID=A0A1I7WB24_HETBA